MQVKTVALKIKRDANTEIFVEVPAHEVPMLRHIHGKENIYPQDGSGDAVDIDPADEAQRLGNKYSHDAVADVFGGAADEAILKLCKENEVKPAKAKAE